MQEVLNFATRFLTNGLSFKLQEGESNHKALVRV